MHNYIGIYKRKNTYSHRFPHKKTHKSSGGKFITVVLVAALFITCIPARSFAAENDNKKSLTTQAQQMAFDMLTLNGLTENGAVVSSAKLNLPSSINGSSISWASSNTSVIAANGTVSMPSDVTNVTLTATISVSGRSVEKNFEVDVVPEAQREAYFRSHFEIDPYIGEGMKLDNKYGDADIKWSGSSYVAEDGTITFPDADTDEVLTATLGSTTKSFKVKIYSKGSFGVEAYLRTPLASDVYSAKLGFGMHLSYDNNGVYEALNNNSGILYAKGIVTRTDSVSARNLKNPYVFVKKDGTYGVLAVRTLATDEAKPNVDDTSSKGSVLYFTSSDLIHYTEIGLVKLSDDFVADVYCRYDMDSDEYVIRYTDNLGFASERRTDSLDDTSGMSAATPCNIFDYETHNIEADGAVPRNTIYVPAAIGNKLTAKLTKLHNTDVEIPETIYAKTEEEVLNTKATLIYSDGSTATKSVDWDLSGVDFTKLDSTYEIEGSIKRSPYFPVTTDPLISLNESAQADPCIFYYEGWYYLTGTNEGNDTHGWEKDMYIRRAETIEGIHTAKKVCILHTDMYTGINNRLWAPEIHEVGGEIYIFFASDPAGTSWSPQCNVMHLASGGDLMNPDDWEEPMRFLAKDGRVLNTTSVGGISLDMTTFNVDGQQYVAWAQRNDASAIYIATVDEEEPWKLTSDVTLICLPDYSWENNDKTPVDEGPYAIITEDKVFITYSGSSTGTPYCVGLLSIDRDADFLDAANWSKSNYPIVDSNSVEGECGVGHNSYTTDADGNLVFVYHARNRANNTGRLSGLRTVQFDADGDPVLYLTDVMELDPQFETVSTKLVIGDKPADPAPTASPSNTPSPAGNNGDKTGQTTQNGNDNDTAKAYKTGDKVSVGGYTYRITSDTTVAVTGAASKSIKSINVKASIKLGGKTYKVTEIAAGAFKGYKKAAKALIGKNIKKIGKKAFYGCSGLKKITVKSTGIKTVGKNAFKKLAKKCRAAYPKSKKTSYKKLFKL